VWLKKYFYVLRPILAVQWIEQGLGVVPTKFDELVEELIKEPDLKKDIDQLIHLKRLGDELDYGPRIDSISDFINVELQRFEDYKVDLDKHSATINKLDELFLSALEEVWGWNNKK
jgi:predicted nucleotidyltransferase